MGLYTTSNSNQLQQFNSTTYELYIMVIYTEHEIQHNLLTHDSW